MSQDLSHLSDEELIARYNAKKQGNTPSESKIGKYAAMVPRSLAALPGYTADLLKLGPDLIAHGIGKIAGKPYHQPKGYGERTKEAIDKRTNNYAKPETKGEKIYEAMLDVVGPGKTHAAKTLVGKIAKNTASRSPQVGGAAIGEITENPYLAIASTVGLSKIGKKSGQIFNNLADNSRLAKLKHNPALKAKVIEALGKQAGGHRIGQVSNSQAGYLAQKAAEDYKVHHQAASAAAYKKPTEALKKYTQGHTNYKRLTPISNVLEPLVEHYHSLEEPAAKAIFLSTAPGKKMVAGLGGTQDIKVPKGQKASVVEKVDHLLSNPDVVEGRLMPIKTAEAFKSDLGDLLKNKELFGTSQEKKISNAYHATKEAVGNKYHEAGAGKAWNAANELVSEHHKKRAPIANAIASHGETKPVGSFKEVHSGLGEDALARDFVSKNLSAPDRQIFSRGTIFELGKESDVFNAATFYKNFSNLPRATKSNILRDLNPQDQRNIGALIKRLKTMGNLEGKKGKVEILSEFLPNWIQNVAIRPVKKLKYNIYTKPAYVKKTTEALKRKAHPSSMKKEHQGYGLTPALSKHVNSTNDLSHLSDEELIARYNAKKQHHAHGDIVRSRYMDGDNVGSKRKFLPGEEHASKMQDIQDRGGLSIPRQSNNDTSSDSDISLGNKRRASLLGDKFRENHILNQDHRDSDAFDKAKNKIERRFKRDSAHDINDVLVINNKNKRRLERNLRTPEVQNQLKSGQDFELDHPVKVLPVHGERGKFIGRAVYGQRKITLRGDPGKMNSDNLYTAKKLMGVQDIT